LKKAVEKKEELKKFTDQAMVKTSADCDAEMKRLIRYKESGDREKQFFKHEN
jgi:hypothetical protein